MIQFVSVDWDGENATSHLFFLFYRIGVNFDCSHTRCCCLTNNTFIVLDVSNFDIRVHIKKDHQISVNL